MNGSTLPLVLSVFDLLPQCHWSDTVAVRHFARSLVDDG
jgi:hypothetical protein